MFWYENDVREAEAKKSRIAQDKDYFFFYGSSSFNYWEGDIENDLEIGPVFNGAFGGSTLAACAWYFPRIVNAISCKAMVLYAGDNDIGDSRHSEEVFLYFTQLVSQWKVKFPKAPVVFLSIKPSPSRAHLQTTIYYANQHIKNYCDKDDQLFYVDIYNAMLNANGESDPKYFKEDGLHMNRLGYELWISQLKPVLKDLAKI